MLKTVVLDQSPEPRNFGVVRRISSSRPRSRVAFFWPRMPFETAARYSVCSCSRITTTLPFRAEALGESVRTMGKKWKMKEERCKCQCKFVKKAKPKLIIQLRKSGFATPHHHHKTLYRLVQIMHCHMRLLITIHQDPQATRK